MQWRSLILLVSGLAVIYIAMLLQDTPYLHPKSVYSSSNHPLIAKADHVIVTTVGAFVYLTSIQYEKSEPTDTIIGTGKLKLGVRGVIKQSRKPIANLLVGRDFLETDGWTPCFEHELKGPISKLSKRNNAPDSQKNETQFAVLYHHIENDSSFHFVRIYYTILQDKKGVTFEYKDIKLPGSTFVNAISLENNSLIFSRDPDMYEFHIMALPFDLLTNQSNQVIENYQLDHGKPVQEWSQPFSTKQYSTFLSRLYSPVPDTYRVFTQTTHKTDSTLYVNVTISDNATSSTWYQRVEQHSDHPVYYDETLDYVGYADMQNPHPRAPAPELIPEVHSSLSTSSTTVVFSYMRNIFITLDYTDRIDILMQIPSERKYLYSTNKDILNEYYYWQGYETVDAEIMGMQLNENGDKLALWTEYNYVYIYTRTPRTTPDAQSSSWAKLDAWLDYLISDMSEEERKLRDTYFPRPWQLEMAITPSKNEYSRSKSVGAVQFWDHRHDSKVDKYIFVGLKNGNVNSYRIDKHEPQKIANFWSFATERWDMLFAMGMVISIFVYNEYQRQ